MLTEILEEESVRQVTLQKHLVKIRYRLFQWLDSTL